MKNNLSPPPKPFLLNSEISNSFLIWIFVLSIILRNIAGLFEIPGIANNPQFTTTVLPTTIGDILGTDLIYKLSYYGYFIIDFFWAFIFLLCLRKVFIRILIYLKTSVLCKKILDSLFIICVILAYVFDIAENSIYMSMHIYPETIVLIKNILYGLAVFFFLIAVIAYFIRKGEEIIREKNAENASVFDVAKTFVLSAMYSLIILAIIGVFLPRAPQVNSIVVALYVEPHNMIFLLGLMAPVFALVLAHYPSYFNINETYRDWIISYKKIPFLGTITYRYNDTYNNNTQIKVESSVNFLLRILGILFYTALFFLIAYTSEVNFHWYMDTSVLAVTILACGILWLYILRKKKQEWYDHNYGFILEKFPNLYDGDYLANTGLAATPKKDDVENISLDDRNALLQVINPVIHRGVLFFFTTIGLHILLFVWLYVTQEGVYTQWVAILSLLCIVFQMISYIYYRTFRTLLQFVFFNEESKVNLKSFLRNTTKEQTTTFFKQYDFKGNRKIFKRLSQLRAGALSDNEWFLKSIGLIGIINLIFFLVINLIDRIAFQVNGILVILSAVLIYYGAFTIVTKNYIYYQYSSDDFAKENRFKFKFGLAFAAVMIFAFNRLARIPDLSNELFTLNPVETFSKESKYVDLDLSTYIDSLSKDDTRYYIGCYGGGMKSNAWTLTILNNLYKNDSRFFEKTIGISGASGGTMGLGNMAAIIDSKETATWDKTIRAVATENILSLDLTHILGRDTFTHLFTPFWNRSGKDRSTKAMKQYAYLTGNCSTFENKTPYRAFWRNVYERNGKHFPILIANTTNVKGNQGMAVSVSTSSKKLRKLLYQNADDILDISMNIYTEDTPKEYIETKQATLSYYDAISTSNRFPLISPAAKIETKGHYNDGGIYENSGLLSVYKLFEAINEKEKIKDLHHLPQRNVFISVVNDKNLYIKHVVDHYLKCANNTINENTEISAILSSVASTEMFPKYIKSKLSRLAYEYKNVGFVTIYLPHQFTVADIKRNYGMEMDCLMTSGQSIAKTNHMLYEIVTTNNDNIRRLVGNGTGPIIEPPMSRVITDKAYTFMVEMLEHHTTKTALQNIKD